MLPQVEQTMILSRATASAVGQRTQQFLALADEMPAARRAERGPSPGSRASNWIRRSIFRSCDAFGHCSARTAALTHAGGSGSRR